MVVVRYFLKMLAGSGRMDEGFVAQALSSAKRDAADPSAGRRPAPSEAGAGSSWVLSPPMGMFQTDRAGYMEGKVHIPTPGEPHL